MSAVNVRGRLIQDPPIFQAIFSSPKMAWFWLVVRVWLGYQWVEAGLHKVTDPAWTRTGESLMGFWTRAVAIPAEGRPLISFDWYRSFIQFLLDTQAYTWFAKVVAYGELLVGIGLIVGAFTGLAAFFGALMNWNFMMAGSASTNPWLFVLALGILGAWKIAGYVGLDYFLLPYLSKLRASPKRQVATAPATK
ncbi:MAG: DoxX family membrane protein [Anaerolineales bacterium]